LSASPLVSIVVNNYNYGRFVGEAIESALAQTYSPVEVVVVDDGSTDDSRSVIEGFSSRILSVFKENGGQGSAYNASFTAAAGAYVCFLDADDTLLPHAIETAVPFFDSPEVSKVQWPLAVVDASGVPTGAVSTRQEPPQGDLLARVLDEGPLYDFEYTTGSMYARWLLERVLPVPEPEYRNGADVYLITLAPAWGILHTVPVTLGTYRRHGSNNYRGRRLDDRRIANYMRRFEANSAALAAALQQRGFAPDIGEWRKRNFNYLWLDRLRAATRDVEQRTPTGATVVLVDGDEWGDGELVPGRRLLPFLERDGAWCGPPPNGAVAVAELERLVQEGATFIALWWTQLWWLEEYEEFTRYLERHGRCVLRSDGLLLWRLPDPATLRKR
jgi:glycosyltransferase involved in cell wall biosynthesis